MMRVFVWLLCFFIGTIVSAAGLGPEVGNGSANGKGVLCLTFDDFCLEWTNAIPLFAKYGAHATFFPSGHLTDEKLSVMKTLDAAGHAVGMHSETHCDAAPFFTRCCPSTYFREQIRPQLDAYAKVGIVPKFFAYPNNNHSQETDAYLSERIIRFRAGAPVGRLGYYSATNRLSVAEMDCAFFPVAELPSHRVMEGVGVGEYYHTDIEDICRGIRRAAARDEVFTIFSHKILPNATGVSMRTAWLEQILVAAKNCGIAVRSFDELGPVDPQSPILPMELILSFDDGLKDHLTIAAPELEKREWRGIFSIVTDWVGRDDKMLTWDDVRELVRRGHVIATHTKTHAGLGGLCRKGKQDAVRQEIRESCEIIERETHVRPKLLCLPGTDCHPDVVKIAYEEGLSTMTVPRSCFGEWRNNRAKDSIARLRRQGVKRADFLVHGVRAEGGGWKPFPTVEEFIAYLDDIKLAERSGEVHVGWSVSGDVR